MGLLRHLILLTVPSIVSTGAIYGAQKPVVRIPVVLSTDVGNEIDDQWAITYLLLHPRFNVLGIMSAQAPTITAPAGHTSYRILVDVVENRLWMRKHPPLVEGGACPSRTPGLRARAQPSTFSFRHRGVSRKTID